jgi:transcriptional regulator with XRE-family HTH domain
MDALAANLKQHRKAAGLTQGQLAGKAGIPRASLANMEQAESNPGIESVVAVANALGVSLDELLTPPPQHRYFKVSGRDIQEYRAADGHFIARLVSPIASRGVQIQVVTMHPGCRSLGRPHPRGSQEFYYTWSGSALLQIGGESVSVEAGSLVQFPGHVGHIYCNPDPQTMCHGLSVVVLQGV